MNGHGSDVKINTFGRRPVIYWTRNENDSREIC